jgi:hypothetical protein
MRPLTLRTLALVALLALGACAPRATPAPMAGLAAASAQQLVDPRPGSGTLDWLGGDVASSAPLAADRYVWIFGDTLLGQARRDCPAGVVYCGREIENDPDRAMIANSVALMDFRDGRPGPLRPSWRTIDGRPAPIFEAARPPEFLWPLALLRAGEPLLVTASVHTRDFGLFSLGSVLLVVHDPDDEPSRWRYTRHALPHAIVATEGRQQLTWATALVPDGKHVVLVGEHGAGPGSQTVLARFDPARANDPAWRPALEYLVTSGERTTWTDRFDEARLFRVPGLPGTSEATFQRASDGTWRTYRIPPGSFEIRLHTAPALTGPWRDRGVVRRIPAPWSTERRADGQPRFIAYAVKAHPELGTPDRPVLTYNVNVTDGSFHSAVVEAEALPAFYVPRTVGAP